LGREVGSIDGEVWGGGYAPTQKEMHFGLKRRVFVIILSGIFFKIWGQFASAFPTPNSWDLSRDPVTMSICVFGH